MCVRQHDNIWTNGHNYNQQAWQVDGTWKVLVIHFILCQMVKCQGHRDNKRKTNSENHSETKTTGHHYKTWQVDSTWHVLVTGQTFYLRSKGQTSRLAWVCILLGASHRLLFSLVPYVRLAGCLSSSDYKLTFSLFFLSCHRTWTWLSWSQMYCLTALTRQHKGATTTADLD